MGARDGQARTEDCGAGNHPAKRDAAFTSEQADKLTNKLAALFDRKATASRPSHGLDGTGAEIFGPHVLRGWRGHAAPVNRQKPAGPEFVSRPGQGYVRTPAWVQYDADMAAYRAALADWQAAGGRRRKARRTRLQRCNSAHQG